MTHPYVWRDSFIYVWRRRCMSCIWMSHVTRMDASCHKVMYFMKKRLCISWKSYVFQHIKKNLCIYVKKIDVFMYKFYVFTYKFYVFMYFMWKLARMKDSCCACKRVISFILMGHVKSGKRATKYRALLRKMTCKHKASNVISFILMGHVTHEDATRRTFII